MFRVTFNYREILDRLIASLKDQRLSLPCSADSKSWSGVESKECPPEHEEPHQTVFGVAGRDSVVLMGQAEPRADVVGSY